MDYCGGFSNLSTPPPLRALTPLTGRRFEWYSIPAEILQSYCPFSLYMAPFYLASYIKLPLLEIRKRELATNKINK